MPRIIVQAANADGEPRRWTLAERIAPANADSEYYMAQLIDRLAWATSDAEALESEAEERAWRETGDRRSQTRPRQRGDRPAATARRTRTA
jgi:hypothetical protein